MSAEIEKSLSERYQLDFTGKSEKEKSEMIKKKLLEHEKKLQKF
jgi:hypothetical protein